MEEDGPPLPASCIWLSDWTEKGNFSPGDVLVVVVLGGVVVLGDVVVFGLLARVVTVLFSDRDGEPQEATLTATSTNEPTTSDRKVRGDTTTGF
jgi:hypothetical protein